MITREGPHFQAICLKVRTLASDHVTKILRFVENLVQNCFQTRSLAKTEKSFSVEEKKFVSRKFNIVENLKMSGLPRPIFPYTIFNKPEDMKSPKPKSAKDFSEAEKSAIVKEVVEDLKPPTLLAKTHNVGVSAIKNWVKESGQRLPSRYKFTKPTPPNSEL